MEAGVFRIFLRLFDNGNVMNLFIYKPSGKSWPGGQRATGSKLAAQLMVEHFPALPTVPRSDQTSPARTRLTLIQLEIQREGVDVYF